MVGPVNPLERGDFHRLTGFPGASGVNQFRFVEAVDGFCQGVIVTIPLHFPFQKVTLILRHPWKTIFRGNLILAKTYTAPTQSRNPEIKKTCISASHFFIWLPDQGSNLGPAD